MTVLRGGIEVPRPEAIGAGITLPAAAAPESAVNAALPPARSDRAAPDSEPAEAYRTVLSCSFANDEADGTG